MKTKLAIALIISTLAIFTLIVVKTSGSSESVVKNSKNPLQNETDLYQVES
jgi:hypothetical protein